ncbi:MAG: hypothetical protein DBX59_04840 [Bacillota bacterium]|nr:MAG: hypothetical protein DBX59_04840 [Bacillota bacterium]
MNNSDFEKNTVSAENQVNVFQLVRKTQKANAALKVLFVGNSITIHGVKEDIGWNRECGMAASCLENDYVHQTVKMLEEKHGPVSYCVVHAADWERQFYNPEVLDLFQEAKGFDADVVVIRIGENSDTEKVKTVDYAPCFERMIDFFRNDHCKTFVTSLFWRYDPFDAPIEAVAKKRGFTFIPIDDLGEKDECKALGEFWHGGVAKHPNDTGMKCIAERIARAVEGELK